MAREELTITGDDIRVPVTAAVLAWALHRSGDAANIERAHPWLVADEVPRLRQLESFADDCRVPLGFLLLDEPPASDEGIRWETRAEAIARRRRERETRCPMCGHDLD